MFYLLSAVGTVGLILMPGFCLLCFSFGQSSGCVCCSVVASSLVKGSLWFRNSHKLLLFFQLETENRTETLQTPAVLVQLRALHASFVHMWIGRR